MFYSRPSYLVAILEAPADYLITVAEAKAQSRVVRNAEDLVIARHIKQAITEAQEITGRYIGLHTLALNYTSLGTPDRPRLLMPVAPIQDVLDVSTQNALGGEFIGLDPLSYVVGEDGAYLSPASGYAWPGGRARIVAEVGYIDREDVPESYVGAILARVDQLYSDRGLTDFEPFRRALARQMVDVCVG